MLTEQRRTPVPDLARLARELMPAVPWRHWVAIGDSTTEGVGDPVPGYPDGGWAQMAAQGLRSVDPELRFDNLGKRYLLTRHIRRRQLPRALALEPDLATVLTGGNDMLHDGFDPRTTGTELAGIVDALLASGATVVLLTMFDIFSSGLIDAAACDRFVPRFQEVCELTRRIAAERRVALVDLACHPASRDPGIYSRDLQHGNMLGHAIAAELVIRRLAATAGE